MIASARAIFAYMRLKRIKKEILLEAHIQISF